MRTTTPNNVSKREHIVIPIVNGEATATINAGQPVILKLGGTSDGLQVVLPGTGTAAQQAMCLYGINTISIAPNVGGEAVAFGVCNAIVRGQTFATGTTIASTSYGQFLALALDSINNCLSVGASQAASNFLPWGVLAASFSFASLASTNSTATVQTASVECFIHIL